MKKKPILTMRLRRNAQARPMVNRLIWVLAVSLVVLVVALAVRSAQHRSALVAWRRSLEAGSTPTPWPAWQAAWPPLERPSRTNAIMGDLSGPYAFAALNSDSLRFIPCYCGCRREGHESVLNCFVKGFTARGTPIWTDHAFTCQTCVNIVVETSRMLQRGMSLRAIREAIDNHHGGLFSRSTATPLPK